ncbi:MAG TPA: hypothetical protein VMF89_32310 [Polyangiales bacterium]|nr:hypothetical protein [Polyangiales bacterium]
MNSLALLLASLLAFFSCTGLYLASPHQRWRTAPLRAKPARLVAGLLALASLYAFTRALDGVAAVYTFGTWIMLLLVVLPYLGAAFSKPRGGAR